MENYRVYGQVITGMTAGLNIAVSRARATYENCCSVRDAALQATNSGFVNISKIEKLTGQTVWKA